MATSVVVVRSVPKTWALANSDTTRETPFAERRVFVLGSVNCARRCRQCLSYSSPTQKKKSFSPLTTLSSSSSSSFSPKTKLYVSGISFRTTEESLRNAFQSYGQLVEVNLVMDKISKRPRGFAFLLYEAEEEAQKAIQGMHGKFLDGRVIFVEELRSIPKQNQTVLRLSSFGQVLLYTRNGMILLVSFWLCHLELVPFDSLQAAPQKPCTNILLYARFMALL